MILKNSSVPLGAKVQVLIDNGCIVDIFINGDSFCKDKEVRVSTAENGDLIYCLNLKEIESIEFSGIDFQKLDLKEFLKNLKSKNEKNKLSCNKTAQESNLNYFSYFSLGLSIVSFIVSSVLFISKFF